MFITNPLQSGVCRKSLPRDDKQRSQVDAGVLIRLNIETFLITGIIKQHNKYC